jgi:hypothetical protein
MPELRDETKRKIAALSTEEMSFEVNLGNRSRFQREKFAYLKSYYESRLREEALKNSTSNNQSMNEAANINKDVNKPERHISIKNFAFLVLVAVFAAMVIWVANHYFGLNL